LEKCEFYRNLIFEYISGRIGCQRLSGSRGMKLILKTTYQTAMRRGEILSLTWGQLGLKEGFIKLRPEDTKTNEGRLAPLGRE
jgi:integrase